MIPTLVLLASLTFPDPDAAAGAFADALRREDPSVVTDAKTLYSHGSLGEIVQRYDEVEVASSRVAAVEALDDVTRLTIEVQGAAVTLGTRQPVPLPRWWSVDVERDGDGWTIASAFTLERRLVLQFIRTSPAQLDAAFAREDVDPEQFLELVITTSTDPEIGSCDALLWALETARRRGWRGIEAYALQELAVLTLPAQPAEALRIVEQSVAIAELMQSENRLADAYFYLGVVLWFHDRIDDAVRSMRAAGALAETVDDPRVALRSIYMAGILEVRRNNLRGALADAERLDALAPRFGLSHMKMDAAAMLAEIHGSLGNHEIQRQQAEAALAAARETRDPRLEAIHLFNVATIGAVDGDPSEGVELVRRAIELARGTVGGAELGVMLRGYAALQIDDRDYDGAERSLEEALELTRTNDDRRLLASLLVARGELRLLQGHPGDALHDAREARRTLETGEGGMRVDTGNAMAEAFTLEGRALRAQGQEDSAVAVLRAAIEIAEAELAQQAVDETGSGAVIEAKLGPYRELLDLFVEQRCPRDALWIAERMRARMLRESLRHGRIDLSAGMDEGSRQREDELERRIAAVNRALLGASERDAVERLQRERDEARLALRRFRSELYLAHNELRARRPEAEGEQPVIGHGELVIEIVVGPDSTLLFALRDDEIGVHRIAVKRADLEKRVRAFVGALENRDYSYGKAARALHELLLRPVAAQVASAKRLRIVPDGVLWRLPFHVLVDEQGRLLAERLPVSYSPSLSSAQRDERARARRGLFVVADPSIGSATASVVRSLYRDPTLGALPDAALEGRAIAKLYADAHVRLGREASESAFKSEARDFRVLHLAAHSIVDDGAPMFSSIVLATAGNDPLEDGLLEAREIADLKLQADLAVLSGCETARGKITPGEGIVGLSWAFLVAGVPTTVVSQWKVVSESTAALMLAFHGRLREGVEPAAALRAAMLELRRDARWRHPFYWAPFVVIER